MQVLGSVEDPNQEKSRFSLSTRMKRLVWPLYSGGTQEGVRAIHAEQDESRLERFEDVLSCAVMAQFQASCDTRNDVAGA